jgi:hypothetical protein
MMMFFYAMQFLKVDHFPLSFKLVVGIPVKITLLIAAQFVRIVTTDRPESVEFIASMNPRLLREFSISAVENEAKASKEYEILFPSLRLVLGGTPFKNITHSRYPRQFG